LFPPEAGLIHGYDVGANIVRGYHHFRDFPDNAGSADTTFHPDGSFSKQNWFPDTIAIAAFDYKGPKPSTVRTLEAALKTAVRTMVAHEDRGHQAGLAAFHAWAAQFREDWEPDVVDDARQIALRTMCHNDAIACILDGRRAGAAFLEQAAAVFAEHAGTLLRAADCCRQVAEMGWKVIAMQGGFRGDAGVEGRLIEPDLRERIAGAIEEAATIEAETCRLLAPWSDVASEEEGR
jgi:hypothetical protein